MDRRRQDAPGSCVVYEAMIVRGGGGGLIPPLPLLKIMLLSQTANGVLLPFILIFMLLLAGDERLMGRHRNGPVLGALAWITAVGLIALTAMMLWFTLR